MYSEVKEKGEEPVIGQAYLFTNKPWGRTGGKIILTDEILTVFQLISNKQPGFPYNTSHLSSLLCIPFLSSLP